MIKKIILLGMLAFGLVQNNLAMEPATTCWCKICCPHCNGHNLSEEKVDPTLKPQLIIAAIKGEEDNVARLLELKADPNCRSTKGMTPLMVAASKGHLNVLRQLLKAGALCSSAICDKKIAYDFAVESSQNAAITDPLVLRKYELIKHDLLIQQLNELLIQAINAPELKMAEIQHILSLGADVNFKYGVTGKTPLLTTIIKNNDAYHELLKLLVAHGADVSQPDRFGTTPLMIAIDDKAFKTVNFLLENGADVNAQNMTGDSALLISTMENMPHVVKKLIECGANVNAANSSNVTPLMFAAMRGYSKVVDILISKGAIVDIDAKDDQDGMSAILASANKGHLSMVQKLVRVGANYLAQNDSYESLMDHAIFSENDALIEFVSNLPVDVSCLQSTEPHFVTFAEFLERTKSPDNLTRNSDTGEIYSQCNTLEKSYDHWCCGKTLSPKRWASLAEAAHQENNFSFSFAETGLIVMPVKK